MRAKQVLIALDQFFNAVSGGWADETLSARAYRCSKVSSGWSKAKNIIDGLFFWQKEHCYNSYMAEKLRLQTSPEYRDKD
jgi:hypothetical protein